MVFIIILLGFFYLTLLIIGLFFPAISRKIHFSILISFVLFGPILKFFNGIPFHYLLVFLIELLVVIFLFKVRIKLTKNNIIYYLIIISMVASLVNSINIFNSIKYILLFIASFLLFNIFTSIQDDKKFLKVLFTSFYLTYVAFAILQKFNYDYFLSLIELFIDYNNVFIIDSWTYSERTVGIGIHPGVNALIISMLGLLVCYFWNKHLVYISIGLLNVITIIWTGNRSVLILFILVFTLIFIIRSFNGRQKVFKFLVSIILIITIVTITIFSDILVRFGEEGNSSIESRFYLYNFAYDLYLEYPIVGAGINNFAAYTERIGGVGLLKEVTHAHNIGFQIMAETGTFGLIILLLYSFHLLRIDKRIIKIVVKSKKVNILFLMGSSAIFLLNTITANPTYIDTTFLLFMLVRGLLWKDIEESD